PPSAVPLPRLRRGRIKLDILPLLSDISVMTEITVTPDLPPAVRRFVLHWGDMGGQWGVNRSVSQIHALLYLAEKPLTAEDIAETLAIARSNVSNSLKELQGWGLVRRVPVMCDRRARGLRRRRRGRSQAVGDRGGAAGGDARLHAHPDRLVRPDEQGAAADA